MIKKGNKRIIITLTPLEQKALEELMEEEEESASRLISRLIRQAKREKDLEETKEWFK